MKEEGWRPEKALLGWGHHLGYRCGHRPRWGLRGRAGCGHCLGKHQGPMAHTHVCTEGLEINPSLPSVPRNSSPPCPCPPHPPKPFLPCHLKDSLKGRVGTRGNTLSSFVGFLSLQEPAGLCWKVGKAGHRARGGYRARGGHRARGWVPSKGVGTEQGGGHQTRGWAPRKGVGTEQGGWHQARGLGRGS